MAEELVSIEVPTVPEHPLDHEKKRKLGDLEADAPDTVEAESKSDEDNEDDNEKAENAEKDDESVLKRPRLGTTENGNENGHQDKGDKLGELEEEKADQQVESQDDIVTGDSDSREQAQEVSAAGVTEEVVDADGQAQEAAGKEQPSDPNVEQNIENESEGAKQEPLQPSSAINQDVDDSSAEQKEGSGDQVRKIEVSNSKVGVLIGKGGDTIRLLQYNSGAKIQIMRDAEADAHANTRPVELIGTLGSIEKAEKLINDVIAEADAGGSPSLVARGFSTVQSVVGDQVEIQVPNEKVGLIIGKGGDTIKNLQTRSGARIQLDPQHLPSGDQSKERTVRITGDKKQIEVARQMIKEVMNQNVRPSPLSGGHGQQAFRPRGPVASQWGRRNPHPSQFMGYDHPQRGPYQSQSQQYPPPYGNYHPQQTTRGSYGPGWEQRAASAMQGPAPQNYNYGEPQGPDYGHPGPYSQVPAHSYGQGGYNEMRYGNIAPAQHPYGGPGVSLQAGYHQSGGPPTGYGPQDHYGRPAPYGMQPQHPQGQTYGQARPSQPGENPYQAPASSTQPYSLNVPPQQSHPYATSGVMQQSYPMYCSGSTPDGYAQPASAATGGPVYPHQGGQPVSGYAQPGTQQASGYAAGGPTAGYGSYPSQQGYTEQPAVNNAAYGYQATADAAAYGTSAQGSTAYAGPTAAQISYAQPAPAQQGCDQPVAQSGGYGTAAAPSGYGKNLSPQLGYAQCDSNQMYGAPR